MNVFVTGGLGFLGSHVVRRLLYDNHTVTLYDRKPITLYNHKPSVFDNRNSYIQGDLLDVDTLDRAMICAKPDLVIHLAALADVRNALKEPTNQVQLNLVATANVLEAMRVASVPHIVFTSSAVVYGTQTGIVTETSALGHQTSIYGAMKLASESLIEAYCEGYGLRGDIFRLVSVVGEGYRHGNLMDFYQRLKADPTQIRVLGSLQQKKFYIYAGDVVEAMMCAVNKHQVEHPGTEIWNVSHESFSTIDDSIDAVCNVLNIDPERLDGGDKWTGDLPSLKLGTYKLGTLGWYPRTSIHEGMRRTVESFVERGL